jgi:hypothetical protein
MKKKKFDTNSPISPDKAGHLENAPKQIKHTHIFLPPFLKTTSSEQDNATKIKTLISHS